jgi:acetolactate synthase-1/2/3 large subunit
MLLACRAKATSRVLDGFHAHAGQIRFIINRQEGGAAFMAEAHGKLTGRPGMCFVTRGPGATNASIGVHTAFQDSTPMVLFVGDVASDHAGPRGFPGSRLHCSFFGPSTKGMAKRVERIDDACAYSRVRGACLCHRHERPARARWCWCCPRTCWSRRWPHPSGAVPQALAAVEAVQAWSDPGALRTLRDLLLAVPAAFRDRGW